MVQDKIETVDRMKNTDLRKKVGSLNYEKLIIHYNDGKWYTRDYDQTIKLSKKYYQDNKEKLQKLSRDWNRGLSEKEKNKKESK